MSVRDDEVCKESRNDVDQIFSGFEFFSPYYRKLLPFLIFTAFTNTLYSLNYVFVAISVDYRCRYECEDNHTLTDLVLNKTLEVGICYKYSLLNDNGDCSVDNFNNTDVKTCHEWVYDEPDSFVAEFQLGCQEWKRTLVASVHSFGYMLGLLLSGPISDKIGRKRLLVFSGITGGVLGITRSLSSSYWVYIMLELLEAMVGDPYSQNYMLGIEMVAKQNRMYYGPLMMVTTSTGSMLFALIAWLIPNWRVLLRVIYAPALIFILHWIYLDESVRWLLINGKKEEAKIILKKAAETNNIELDEEKLDNIEIKETSESISLVKLLKMTFMSRKLLLRFLACILMWFTATFNKYGTTIHSVSLEGNRYVNYAVTALADIPAAVLLVVMLVKFKRRGPLICTFLIGGLFCIIQSMLPKGYPVLSVALFFVGKMAVAQSFSTLYLYTTELFPTYTRNTMHAICSSFGRIGSILASQTPLLIQYWSGLPSVIIGSLSLITGLIVMLMPDTAEDVLPDTIKEAEAVGTKETIDRRATVKLL